METPSSTNTSSLIDDILDQLEDLDYSIPFCDQFAVDMEHVASTFSSSSSSPSSSSSSSSSTVLPPTIATLLNQCIQYIAKYKLLELQQEQSTSASATSTTVSSTLSSTLSSYLYLDLTQSTQWYQQVVTFITHIIHSEQSASNNTILPHFEIDEMIHFLLAEWQAYRMIQFQINKNHTTSTSTSTNTASTYTSDDMQVDSVHNNSQDNRLIYNLLHQLATYLHIDDHNIHEVNTILQLIQQKINALHIQAHSLPAPIIKSSELNAKQMAIIGELNSHFKQDYTIRKRMLLKRVEVTLDSMLYSKKVDGQKESIREMMNKKLQALTPETNFPTSSIFVVTPAHLAITKITDKPIQSALKSVTIGAVPDRGGRVDEPRLGRGSASSSSYSRPQSARGGGHHGGGRRGGHQQRGGHEQQNQPQQQQPAAAAAAAASSAPETSRVQSSWSKDTPQDQGTPSVDNQSRGGGGGGRGRGRGGWGARR